METMYRIFCEWDIGQEYLVFTSISAAIDWACEAFDEDEMGMTVEEARADGLLGYVELEVVA